MKRKKAMNMAAALDRHCHVGVGVEGSVIPALAEVDQRVCLNLTGKRMDPEVNTL